MTSNERLTRELPEILRELAGAPTLDLLDDVLVATAQRRQRPAWTFPERWLPMTTLTRSTVTPSFPWRPLAVVAAILALIVAMLALQAGSQPRLPSAFGPAANGLVAYSADGAVFVQHGLGGPTRQVIGSTGPGSGPDYISLGFSPLGRQLLVARELDERWELHVAPAAGGDFRRIAGPVAELGRVEWSPDETRIAFSYLRDGLSRIGIAAADGSGATELSLPHSADEPTWRPPDGRQLAIRTVDRGAWGLSLVNPDGTGLTPLDIPRDRIEAGYEGLAAAWSPDGTRLAFHRLVLTPGNGNGNGFRIAIADVDAAGVVTATASMEFQATSDDEHAVSWMPDGQQILFLVRDGSDDTLMRAEPVRGARPFDLGIRVSGDFGQIGAAVAPDGRSILVHDFATGRNWSVVPDLDPTTTRELSIQSLDTTSDDPLAYQRIAP